MDVAAVSGPALRGGPGHLGPLDAAGTPSGALAQVAATQAAPAAIDVVDALGIAMRNRENAPHLRPDLNGGGKARVAQVESTTEGPLKFDLASADVLARFWIDESSRRVIVTMYQRDTGEVIRQSPPREILDVVAVLEGIGLTVDTSR